MNWKYLRILTQFRVSFLFLLMYLVALYLAKDLGRWFILLLVQPFIIWLIATLMYSGIPKSIMKASNDNVYRMDGSESIRRRNRELRALRRFRGDIYALLMNITLSGSMAMVAFAGSLQHANPFESSVAILSLSAFWIVGGSVLIHRTYAMLLSCLLTGIKRRRNEYFSSDVQRLQEDHASELQAENENMANAI